MSLSDAMLLEEPMPDLSAPPTEVWLTCRNDGLAGSGPNKFNIGMSLKFCENLLVENNIVDLAAQHLITDRFCTNVEYFNNTDPAGRLIRGEMISPSEYVYFKRDELSTMVEDVAFLNIL